MEYTVRKATIEDYKGLCEILSQLDFQHSSAIPDIFKVYGGPARAREYMTAMINNERSVIYAAESQGTIIGTLHAYIRETPDINVLVHRVYGVIDDFIVKDGFRGQGVGRALMDTAHSWFIENGVSQVDLNVWEFNGKAIDFYEKAGYTTISRRMSIKLKK
jgi:Acetyltransferases